jgi:hypothetical protein
MESASDKFKIVLLNMQQEELLNFIWAYDQYIKSINNIRIEKEQWDICPLNIEDFYKDVYKRTMNMSG